MPWVKTFHDQCNLPTQDKINEFRVKPGSLWKCGAQGCNEVWRYEGGTTFTPMEETTVFQPKTPDRSREDDPVVPQPQVHQATAIGVGTGVELRAILEQRASTASGVLEAEVQPVVDEHPVDPPAPCERKRTKFREVRCACAFVDWAIGLVKR